MVARVRGWVSVVVVVVVVKCAVAWRVPILLSPTQGYGMVVVQCDVVALCGKTWRGVVLCALMLEDVALCGLVVGCHEMR